MIKNRFVIAFLSTGLLAIVIPPSFSNPDFDKESRILNKDIITIEENNLNTYIPKNKTDEYIIKGANYATKFVPLMNSGSEGSNYTNLFINDGKRLLVDSGFDLINSSVDNQINRIPFLAQTSISISGGADKKGDWDSDLSFSLNSLLKLGELAVDESGDIKTLSFSQVRVATGLDSNGTTTNLGFGIRHRPNEVSMVGGNIFWDYRMTDYSNAHSRLGLGGEYLWKDLEIRNNWYIPITAEKDVTVGGSNYKEKVVPGWDAEIGYRLPNYPELAFFVRGFNWDYKNTQDNSGLEGSVSWQASPFVGVEIWVSNEISGASSPSLNSQLPGINETFFGLRMNITSSPLIFGKKEYKNNIITQMTQPVKRRYDVLLERSGGNFVNRAKGA